MVFCGMQMKPTGGKRFEAYDGMIVSGDFNSPLGKENDMEGIVGRR